MNISPHPAPLLKEREEASAQAFPLPMGVPEKVRGITFNYTQ